jgi:excisionase family DNA binding protein
MNSRHFLTVFEVSEFLGRSPSAIRNLVMRGRIPYRKLAGRLIFFPEEIETWITRAEGLKVDEVLQQEGNTF